MRNEIKRSESGFSLVELLIVISCILLMSGFAVFYMNSHQRLYKADDQALTITDILQEARQRSLTQRETIRVEIDKTDNIVRLIDENEPDSSNDDRLLRQITLKPETELVMLERPSEISVNPPEPLPVPTAQFQQSVYTPSHNHNVCTFRFRSNGTVTNAGNNSTGGGAGDGGATIHIWTPKISDPQKFELARAITVIGSTGSIRLWEYDRNLTQANKWKDSRRTGSYGGL